MGKKAASARAVSEYLPPLVSCVVVYFVVLSGLVYFQTVESLLIAAIFAGCSGISVFCLMWQGTKNSLMERDAQVRELFRRTSMTYSRLKSAIRQDARGSKAKGAGLGSGSINRNSIPSSPFHNSAPSMIPASNVKPNESPILDALPAKIVEAVRLGDVAAIERWIRVNNVDTQDDGSGSSLLHFAALEGQSRICRVLLNAGANPVLQDLQGNQPLHIAAAKGSAVLVKYLCEHGAEPYSQNVERVSPMDLAEEFDNRGCVLIMERSVRSSASIGSSDGTGALRGRTPRRDLGV